MYSQSPLIPQPLKSCRQIFLASYVCLLALYGWLNLNREEFSFVILTIQWVPLLLPAMGIWKDNARSYDWLCFISLAYFLFIVPIAMSEQAAVTDWLQLLLVVSVFTSAMFTSRWLKAWKHQLALDAAEQNT